MVLFSLKRLVIGFPGQREVDFWLLVWGAHEASLVLFPVQSASWLFIQFWGCAENVGGLEPHATPVPYLDGQVSRGEMR